VKRFGLQCQEVERGPNMCGSVSGRPGWGVHWGNQLLGNTMFVVWTSALHQQPQDHPSKQISRSMTRAACQHSGLGTICIPNWRWYETSDCACRDQSICKDLERSEKVKKCKQLNLIWSITHQFTSCKDATSNATSPLTTKIMLSVEKCQDWSWPWSSLMMGNQACSQWFPS
jgi:hypothetical protein